MVFNRKKDELRTPVTNQQDDRRRMDELLKTPVKEPLRSSYVDRKLKEATDALNEKKNEMTNLQQEMQERVNEASILQEIRDGKAGMYITDILDMIDDYRSMDFDDQNDLLSKFEQEVIRTTVQDLQLRKKK